MQTIRYQFPVVLVLAVLCVSAGCLSASEEHKQVYALAHETAAAIYETGTEPHSPDAAIVVRAAELATTTAGPPVQPIAAEQFSTVADAAAAKAASDFWGTPLGEMVELALLAAGLSGLAGGLKLLRNRTRLFETVVGAIDVFAEDHPRSAKDLKAVIGDKSQNVKGFDRAVDRAKTDPGSR